MRIINKKQILKKTLTLGSMLLLILFIISLSPKPMQNDTFWSIKVGEEIVNKGIITTDSFSMHKDLKYIAHHFLTDVVIYLTYGLAGFGGLYALEVFLAIIMAVCFYLLNYQLSKNKEISYFVVFVQMFLMLPFIAVRAQMLSYIVFIIEIILLEKYLQKSKKKYLIGLLTLPIILANFHMGVIPFYFVILAVYIIGFTNIKIFRYQAQDKTDHKKIKRFILLFFISALTTLINPYFFKGATYAFKTMGNTFITTSIQEFQAMSFSSDMALYFLICVFTTLLLLTLINDKIKITDMLLFLGTTYMAFKAPRYVALFVICSTVMLRYYNPLKCFLGQQLKPIDIKAIKYTIIIIIICLSCYNIYLYSIHFKKTEYVPKTFYPVEATEYLKQILKEEDILFNEYAWGSYLMLNDIKVFIDSRCDLYTEEYNKHITVAKDFTNIYYLEDGYEKVIDKYNFTILIFPKESTLNKFLQIDPNYYCEYEDETAVIYKKGNE